MEGTVSINISHLSGPDVADEVHVIRWLCADGAWIDGARNGFRFQVCPDHSDPEECYCTGGEVSTYAADITAADIIKEAE